MIVMLHWSFSHSCSSLIFPLPDLLKAWFSSWLKAGFHHVARGTPQRGSKANACVRSCIFQFICMAQIPDLLDSLDMSFRSVNALKTWGLIENRKNPGWFIINSGFVSLDPTQPLQPLPAQFKRPRILFNKTKGHLISLPVCGWNKSLANACWKMCMDNRPILNSTIIV